MLEKSFPKSFYYYFVDDYSELVKDISDISFSDCVLGDAQGAQTRVKAWLSLLQRVEALSSRTRLQQLHPSQAVQCQEQAKTCSNQRHSLLVPSVAPAAEPRSSECRESLVKDNCLKHSSLQKAPAISLQYP